MQECIPVLAAEDCVGGVVVVVVDADVTSPLTLGSLGGAGLLGLGGAGLEGVEFLEVLAVDLLDA